MGKVAGLYKHHRAKRQVLQIPNLLEMEMFPFFIFTFKKKRERARERIGRILIGKT